VQYDEDIHDKMTKERYVTNEIFSDDRGLIGWKIERKQKDGEATEEILYTEELIA
jgi:hypothetical protein